MTGYALVDVVTDRPIGCTVANQLWVAALPPSARPPSKVPPGLGRFLVIGFANP